MLGAVQDGDARRVIAPVFQAAQALHQDGDYVAFRYRSDDSTHDLRLPLLTDVPVRGRSWPSSLPENAHTRWNRSLGRMRQRPRFSTPAGPERASEREFDLIACRRA